LPVPPVPAEPEAVSSQSPEAVAPQRRRLRLTLEFDGNAFKGWQRQAQGERTVQGVIEGAFGRLPGEHGSVNAAGRTDAGVHALALVAHVDTTSSIPDEKLRLALNAHLPDDVVVLEVASVERTFEAQYDCLYRRYLYRLRVVRDDRRGLAIARRRLLPVYDPVDVSAMQKASAQLLGRHDFAAFATQESRTTTRTVLLAELREEAGELRLHIAADGFLRNMVRTIVGTLLWVGVGKLAADDMASVIASADRRLAGPNVAPHGLYFVEAGYRPWDLTASEARLTGLVL